MKVLALCGSLRAASTTRMALEAVVARLVARGAECELLCGEAMDLPLYRDGWTGPWPENLARLKRMAAEADAFLLGSPEYHGGMSGTLKNALDWLGVEEFGDKPAALLAVAGGHQGAYNTLNAMRLSLRWIHAWVLPHQVSIGASWAAFDAAGRPIDAKTGARLQALGDALLQAAALLAPLRSGEAGTPAPINAQEPPVAHILDPAQEADLP